MTEENTQPEVVDKVINEDLQEELNAYIFFSDEKDFLWVPPPYLKSDIPKDQWPVVKIRCRDGVAMAKAEDELGYESKNNKLYTESGTVRIKTIREDVIDWKNIKDAKGNEIKCMTGNNGLSEKLVRKMPMAFQTGIYGAINRQLRLTEEQLTGLDF